MRIAPLVPIVGFALAMSASPDAQNGASAEVTFAKDIAPILQRSCQHCHNASGVSNGLTPMMVAAAGPPT